MKLRYSTQWIYMSTLWFINPSRSLGGNFRMHCRILITNVLRNISNIKMTSSGTFCVCAHELFTQPFRIYWLMGDASHLSISKVADVIWSQNIHQKVPLTIEVERWLQFPFLFSSSKISFLPVKYILLTWPICKLTLCKLRLYTKSESWDLGEKDVHRLHEVY